MKIKSTKSRPVVPFILLTIFCVHTHLSLSNLEQEFFDSIAYADHSENDASYQAKKFDDHHSLEKDVVFGDKLWIKDSGLICKNLRAGSILANNQLSFNNKGCNPLLVKGAKEKNLLNLRSKLCFAAPPGLSCTLNMNHEYEGPTVGCLDISSSLPRNTVNVCSGFGIFAKQATVFVSGTGCQDQLSQYDIGGTDSSIKVVSTVQVEICIPIFFCTKFCDRPTLQVTYNENTCETQAAGCKDRIISEGQGTTCELNGHSVTTFLSAHINVQKVSCKDAFIKFQLLYQNCIGITYTGSNSIECADELRETACAQQKLAIEDICKEANVALSSTRFDIKVEGRVL